MIEGMASSKPRRIVILAFPGVQPLDVIGPAEVFAGADGLAGGGAYEVEVVAQIRTRSAPGSRRSDSSTTTPRPDSIAAACRAEATRSVGPSAGWIDDRFASSRSTRPEPRSPPGAGPCDR